MATPAPDENLGAPRLRSQQDGKNLQLHTNSMAWIMLECMASKCETPDISYLYRCWRNGGSGRRSAKLVERGKLVGGIDTRFVPPNNARPMWGSRAVQRRWPLARGVWGGVDFPTGSGRHGIDPKLSRCLPGSPGTDAQ